MTAVATTTDIGKEEAAWKNELSLPAKDNRFRTAVCLFLAHYFARFFLRFSGCHEY